MAGRTNHYLLLHPRDPLIVRDARPFAADPGVRAHTLAWPLPQTVAGALRTHIGHQAMFDWALDGPVRALNIQVHGPFAVARHTGTDGWQVHLPAPLDAVMVGKGSDATVRALRPVEGLAMGAGCDLPAGLRPLCVKDAEKPAPMPAFWSLADTCAWLAAEATSPPHYSVQCLKQDTRVHVAIDPAKQTSAEGLLFSTTGLVFPEDATNGEGGAAMAMLCRVSGMPVEWRPAPAMLPLGGERRLTALEPCSNRRLLDATPELTAALNGAKRLRLQLVTPAIFEGGWLPDGDAKQPFAKADGGALEGLLPGLVETGPRLRLVSAAVGRKQPVSGYSVGGRRPGIKATRYAVPAGSVFFFETVDRCITEQDVERLWLRSICGRQQDRLDGFGLVVPGVW